MLESTPTNGSIETSDAMKREYAARSREFNAKNVIFRKLFKKYLKEDGNNNEEDDDDDDEDDDGPSPASKSSSATRRPTANSSSTANTRHESATAAGAAAPPAPAVANEDGPLIVTFLGMKMRESTVYDMLVAIIILVTLIFATIYFKFIK